MTTREIWLRGNRRAIVAAFLGPVSLIAVGAVLWIVTGREYWYWNGIAAGLVLVGLVCAISLVRVWRAPRLAYEQGELLVFLRSSLPERVPIEHVECFFPGQGPSMMAPGNSSQARTIVVRLAEAARGFRDRSVHRSLGEWRECHITIRGTWCEPIDGQSVKRLNDQLVSAKRQWAASRGAHRP